MSTPDNLRALIGTWTGTNRLFLPDAPTRESPSTASVALAAGGKFCTVAYTWVFDDEPQDGLLILGVEPEGSVVNAVFIDSWHMGDAFMIMRGQIEANNTIVVRGSYAVEASPDWGWRIGVEPRKNALRVVMYNVSPDGDEWLGVEATYTRTA